MSMKNGAVSAFNQDFWRRSIPMFPKEEKVLYWYKNKLGKWRRSVHENYEDRRFNKFDVDNELVTKMLREFT